MIIGDENMKNKTKKTPQIIITIIAILLLIGATTFAYYTYTKTSGENKISTGTLRLTYQEPEEGLTINPENVLTNAEGIAQTEYFPFYVEANATGTVDLAYYIYLTVLEGTTLENSAVKVYLSQVASETATTETQVLAPTLVSSLTQFDPTTLASSTTSNHFLLYSNTYNFTGSATKKTYYRLRMWLHENYRMEEDIKISHSGEGNSTHQATINSKTFKIKINVYGHDGTKKTIR